MSSLSDLSCSLCECGCGDGQCGWECDCPCCKPVRGTFSLSPFPAAAPASAPAAAPAAALLSGPALLQYKLVVVDAGGCETASPWFSMPPCEFLATIMAATASSPALTCLRQGLLDFYKDGRPQLEDRRPLLDVAATLLSCAARRANKCYILSACR